MEEGACDWFSVMSLLLLPPHSSAPGWGYHPSQTSSMWVQPKGWSPSGVESPSVGPSRKSAPEGSSFLQSTCGMLQGCRVNIYSTMVLYALQGENLLHRSLLPSNWNTSLLSFLWPQYLQSCFSPSPSHPFPSTLRSATSVNDWLSLGCAVPALEPPEMGSVQSGAAPSLLYQKPSLQLPAPKPCHINSTQTYTQ